MNGNTNPQTHAETFSVPATHPALTGHFPGAPIIPGVMLLDRVAAAIERVWALRVTGLPQVKFLYPLLPGQEAGLTLADCGPSVSFHIVHAAATIATGRVEVTR